MRELKFRAWDKVSKKMILNVGVTMCKKSNVCPESHTDISIHNKKVELMQFTGLKDKNGKEIYEGDIIKLGTCEAGFLIEYYEGRFGLKNIRYLKDIEISDIDLGLEVYRKRIEVIGNIYENKELLK